MALLLKVACPDCGQAQASAPLGAEIRCLKCGRDYRAQGDGEGASRIISVTPDEMDSIPYSQRSVEVPVNSVSSLIVADPALLYDRMLRDAPLRENARWVGKVRLIKKLGQGGMGAVYRGFDESLALDVAVKILPLPSGARDDQFVQRFRQEARISARINHPNVVRTLHVEEQGDLIFLVMDYVEGQTARKLVESKGPLMLPLALQIIHDASLGMQAAHAHDVVHRDIKPENILIGDDGRVLLSDLGLAKAISTGGRSPRMPITRLGLLLGTPAYMSPEQWDVSADITAAVDIWSMGATLWMLLTQKPPFDEKDMALLARRIREAPLPDIREVRPNLPDCVLDLLQRCLAKKPEDRFDESGELLSALNAALEELASGRARVTPRPPPRPLTPPGLPVPQLATATAQPTAPQTRHGQDNRGTLAGVSGRRAAKPARRATWAAGLVLASAAGWAAYTLYTRSASPPPAPVEPAVALDLSYPAHIKPGQEAELSALVSSADPERFAVLWISGEKAYAGGRIRVPLAHDADFTVVVRDKHRGREAARREVKVSVDLQAHAAEKDLFEIISGTPLKFEGRVEGGPRTEALEMRWVEMAQPDTAIAGGAVLNLAENSRFRNPGRYAFVFQARRKDSANWSGAATDKVVVQVARRVPAEFTAAVQAGSVARQRALQAASGTEALAAWKEALAAFEKATAVFDGDDEAKLYVEQCRQRLNQEEKYLGLLKEARRLREAAESVPEADGLRRLAAWSEALQPCTAAGALFDREEVRTQAAAAEAKIKALKTVLESAEDERTRFERLIAHARREAKEAAKYVNPSVALPHWEEALSGFMELSKGFPKRVDEFALELKEAQENRDKAFLYNNLGIIPARAPEKTQVPGPPRALDSQAPAQPPAKTPAAPEQKPPAKN